ncbi:MAG: alpha/beta fold hydrolase [Candidatus Hodarchaeales archaeon]|jgi:pimeloyl-ACP methyl ester carboxylesterase
MVDEVKTSQTMILSSGRRLGYSEYGLSSGKPVFSFHGRDGSRLEAVFGKENLASDLGIKLICPDRPGMGLSGYQKNRSILDWPSDVLELASHLDLDKFVVLGGSGGAPYALACVYKIPEHLTGCAVVSGLGPYEISKKELDRRNKSLLFIARYLSWTFQPLLWLMMARKIEDENWWEKNYQKLYQLLPEPDRRMVSDPVVKERMTTKTIEAYRHGSKGPAHDFKLYARPWGFKLNELSNKIKVKIFHGELDETVPISIARAISEQIPNCETKFYPNEAHLSVFINNFQEIIRSLFQT